MQRANGRLLFSPSDLNHFLECEHLTQLERKRDPGRPRGPRDAQADLLAEKGAEHERVWLERFRAESRRIVTIEAGEHRDWESAAARTVDAMRAGADVIYQGVFTDGDWHGISDFLVRVDTPSSLGPWSYEAWDTKLARRSKPYFAMQLCFYTEQVARVQGTTPEHMVIVLGTNEHDRLRYRDFDAYYRVVRGRFVEAARSGQSTYPYPVGHCGLCEYQGDCQRRWEEDDHLSQVATIRRDQVERLNAAGVTTVAALAEFEAPARLGIGEATFARLRHQATLQSAQRRDGVHRCELLPADERTGFRLLPRPSEGDVFFDMEGDPYFEPTGGLEYLFGVMTVDGGGKAFQGLLGLDREGEKRAFEAFIDLLQERLRRWPDLHVYHYAAYEVTALKRLMSQHATREDAVDDLLRREVFVDLYQVVRQSIRISYPSYSIKKVRSFFMKDAGKGAVTGGGDSIIEFERWRRTGDAEILKAITDYNEEDCLSTVQLRDWLLERRAEAQKTTDREIPWKAPGDATVSDKREEEDALTLSRREHLIAMGTPEARLLADLVGYHRREDKPEWWTYFDRRKKSLDELLDDTEAISHLAPAVGEEPVAEKKSKVHTLTFPPQEYKLSVGKTIEDPFREERAGEIVGLDAQQRRLRLKRGPKLADVPMPVAVVAGAPIGSAIQREAVGRVADAFIAGENRYRAVRSLLARDAPRVRGRAPGSTLQTMDLAEQRVLVAALDDSYLFLQGPPGSGKTYTGARLIVSLIAAGKRVGVAALSHKAINNLLEAVEEAAAAEGVTFSGLKKCGDDDDGFVSRAPNGSASIVNTTANDQCETADVSLIAGTSWLFSRPGMDGRLDYLFIDEAGQIALADAVAMAASARSLVLLGDPQQLPQIRQGTHPEGAGLSVLEHLLGEDATVPEDRGIFLEQTYRMHPDVCGFISSLSYDGRLESAPGRERQRITSAGLAGTGLRFIPVEHTGNAQQSREEADVVAQEVRRLLDGGTFTDTEDRVRPLMLADILVVAPYNMQVQRLREVLPPGVDVGTVDKFQGREAPVVFFSMASSTGEDVPRGLEFLLNRNRLNVAISRARALAVVVCSPRLLDVRCSTLDQMRLANNLCRLAEMALSPEAVASA